MEFTLELLQNLDRDPVDDPFDHTDFSRFFPENVSHEDNVFREKVS